jgi:hypothetical protein
MQARAVGSAGFRANQTVAPKDLSLSGRMPIRTIKTIAFMLTTVAGLSAPVKKE